MKGATTVFAVALLGAISSWAADAGNGALVLDREGCVQCHTVRGQGAGHEAPLPARDLADRLAARYSPAALASDLWNHTPEMRALMEEAREAPPEATEAEWQDLFAYLYSLQFFDLAGQTRRGARVLEDKGCTNCHALAAGDPQGVGPPVTSWERIGDPIALAYRMWNHAPQMRDQLAEQRGKWKTLSGRDFLDLTAYLQNIQNVPPNRTFSMPDPAEGKDLFESNCGQCHRGSMALGFRLRDTTWMEIAAGMWNHAPQMQVVPLVSADDMSKILAYVWELQYEGPSGNTKSGERAFDRKGCVNCHRDANGQPRHPNPGRELTPFSMAALAWGPSRAMHESMRAQNIDWPELSATDIADLVAYLNSLE